MYNPGAAAHREKGESQREEREWHVSSRDGGEGAQLRARSAHGRWHGYLGPDTPHPHKHTPTLKIDR